MSFIICGCPRSGTTVLSDYLCQTNNIMCFHELANYIWSEDFEKRYKEYIIISKEKNNVKIPIEYIDISEPNKICEKIEDRFGCICGDKLPDYCLFENMSIVVESNPNIKVIFLIRNVYDFITSSLYHYKNNVISHWCFEKIKDAEKFWCKYNTNIIKSIGLLQENNYLIIRYENLVSNLKQVTQNIENLLNTNIDYKDGIIQQVSTNIKYNLSNETKCLMEFMGYKGFDYIVNC